MRVYLNRFTDKALTFAQSFGHLNDKVLLHVILSYVQCS